jgi:magnesium transporter
MKDNVFWLDINCPSKADLKSLAEVKSKLPVQLCLTHLQIFNIHTLTMEDISSTSIHEKCEKFDDYIFMTLKVCNPDFFNEMHGMPPGNSPPLGRANAESPILYILMFKKYTITLHFQPLQLVKQVIRRIFQRRSKIEMSSDWYLYFILDEVTDRFDTNIKKIEQEVDALDESTLFLKPADQTEMLRRIGRARKMVTHLTRLLKPKVESSKILVERLGDMISVQPALYLRDTREKLQGFLSDLDQNSETLTRAHSNYLAQISIEQAEMSNRMNLQVKHLTVITSLALPFEIIGALWGMNVVVPFEFIENRVAELQDLQPFFGLCVGSILLSCIFWLLGKRLRFF